jgi:glutathione S-transferase
LIETRVQRRICIVSLTLFHSVESTCAQKVRIVLAEKRLRWQEVRLNLRKGEQFEPDYLKLNPKAVVPTLRVVEQDQETVVRESSVINEYLDDAFPEVALKPTLAAHRARMRLTVKAFDDEVHPAIGILSYAIFLRHQMNELKSPEELAIHFKKVADPMRRERQMRTHELGLASPTVPQALKNLAKVVAMLDQALSEHAWLAGPQFSLADAAAIPYMVRAQALRLGSLWEERPRVNTWFEQTIKRTADLQLEEIWGSISFAAMVAEHALADAKEIERLLGAVES